MGRPKATLGADNRKDQTKPPSNTTPGINADANQRRMHPRAGRAAPVYTIERFLRQPRLGVGCCLVFCVAFGFECAAFEVVPPALFAPDVPLSPPPTPPPPPTAWRWVRWFLTSVRDIAPRMPPSACGRASRGGSNGRLL